MAWSEEAKERLRRLRRDPAYRAAQSARMVQARKGKAASWAGAYTPEVNARRSSGVKAAIDVEQRRATAKKLWQDPAYRERNVAAAGAGMRTEAARKRRSGNAIAYWQALPEEERARLALQQSRTTRRLWRDPTFAKRVLSGQSYLELAVQAELGWLGIAFESQASFGVYYVDIAVHERRLVIECDSYWHMGREAKVRDAQCDAAVRAVGYTVVRLRSDEINADVVHAVQRALAAVDDMEVVLFA